MFEKQELIKSIKTIFEELIILDNFTILTDNGPYKDKELPLRFNCHLLIIGCFLLKKNLIKREQFIKLENFFSNLIKNNAGYGYKFRESLKSKKDTVNGLIGPAWIAECLIYAGITLKKNDYLDICTKFQINCSRNVKVAEGAHRAKKTTTCIGLYRVNEHMYI